MNETTTELKESDPQKTLDEFGIARGAFDDAANSKFFRLKDGEKAEVSFKSIKQITRQFHKFENGKVTTDAEGKPIVEREGPALSLEIDKLNGQVCEKVWEVSSKKVITAIFSFLDRREKDNRPFLFSRTFSVERKGSDKTTQYLIYPLETKTA